MDNNAFRTLVNQKVKSTKEIAREAVETEFRQAQKRGGGGRRGRGDYDSDSASDDDALTKRRRDDHKRQNDEGKDEPEWKRRRKEKGAASTTTGYRDRAKERREGKNLDYSDTVSTTIHTTNGDESIDRRREAELSKFLGGDEQHTHLVKGLDMALAQKVRREEMGEERVEEDLDQLLEDAYTTRREEMSSSSSSNTTKSSVAMIQPKSELGKSVQHYLLQLQKRQSHYIPTATTTNNNTRQQSIQINPTKQNSIQRSHYTFSLDSTIQKRGNAWDLPQLQMVGGVSGQHHHQQQSGERRRMTPLDGHLIATIRKKLDDALTSSSGGGCKRKLVDNGVVERVEKNDNGVQQQQQQPSSSLDKEGDSNKQSHDENDSNHKTLAPPLGSIKKDAIDDDDEDSDDDIFANVGAYVPPTAVSTSGNTAVPTTAAVATAAAQTNDNDTTPSTAATTKKQSSIFDNLITDQNSNDVNTSRKRQSMQLPQTQQKEHQYIQLLNDQNKNVIDRDVFGGNWKQDEQQADKRRGPQTAAMEGVSMTNYQGGYGEEMDTDFLNEDEDGFRKLKRRSDNDDGEDKTVDVDGEEED